MQCKTLPFSFTCPIPVIYTVLMPNIQYLLNFIQPEMYIQTNIKLFRVEKLSKRLIKTPRRIKSVKLTEYRLWKDFLKKDLTKHKGQLKV